MAKFNAPTTQTQELPPSPWAELVEEMYPTNSFAPQESGGLGNNNQQPNPFSAPQESGGFGNNNQFSDNYNTTNESRLGGGIRKVADWLNRRAAGADRSAENVRDLANRGREFTADRLEAAKEAGEKAAKEAVRKLGVAALTSLGFGVMAGRKIAEGTKSAKETAQLAGMYAKDKFNDVKETAQLTGMYAKDITVEGARNAKNRIADGVLTAAAEVGSGFLDARDAVWNKADEIGESIEDKIESMRDYFVQRADAAKKRREERRKARFAKREARRARWDARKDLVRNAGNYVKDNWNNNPNPTSGAPRVE